MLDRLLVKMVFVQPVDKDQEYLQMANHARKKSAKLKKWVYKVWIVNNAQTTQNQLQIYFHASNQIAQPENISQGKVNVKYAVITKFQTQTK